jgi:hypothetical protein
MKKRLSTNSKPKSALISAPAAPSLTRLKERAWAVAKFFKVIDPDHTLSLTNTAVLVVIVKLIFQSEAISPVDIGALVGTLLPYTAKKWVGKQKNHNEPE